jgi:hypothetical protein
MVGESSVNREPRQWRAPFVFEGYAEGPASNLDDGAFDALESDS